MKITIQSILSIFIPIKIIKNTGFYMLVAIVIGSSVGNLLAQDNHHNHDHDMYAANHGIRLNPTWFTENKGQWHENVVFKSNLKGEMNYVYLEENRFVYFFSDQSMLQDMHSFIYGKKEDKGVDRHQYAVNFVGSSANRIVGSDKRKGYLNYFIGNDKSKWASKVGLFNLVSYENLYDGIDLHVEKNDRENLKYEFIVAPGADPNQIAIQYQGAEKVWIEDNEIHIIHSVGKVIETKPYSYQIINDKIVKVSALYFEENGIIKIKFPEGYDSNHSLVIDPEVIAATLAGSNTAPSSLGVFGHCGTYDSQGNMYTGGTAYGPGYNTSIGAFDSSFNSILGDTDFGITKYNPTGTEMLYGTYIGGADRDTPHSIIVDQNHQLYIYGTTASTNFPTTQGAIQEQWQGGIDIVVSVLNNEATDLIGSTYFGGSSDDGIDDSGNNTGDMFRGEIVLGKNGRIYIASTTSSADIPLENGFNTEHNGSTANTQDGIAISMSADCKFLFWSTLISSEGVDSGAALRVLDNLNVVVVGVAGGDFLPTTEGVIQPNNAGGRDAYIIIISPDGSEVIAATYWGTEDSDRAYFIDVDKHNQIHIFGQSTGIMPITEDTYTFGQGSEFITAFDQNLTEIIYSTQIGSSNDVDQEFTMSPVAFLVDDCDHIYISGYNTLAGFPLTDDAIEENEKVFYFAIFEPNCAGLDFASYYGDATHVDGGTSRFDKSGVIYQAVCSCDGQSMENAILNTTPGALGPSDGLISRCDVGIFKIDLERNIVTASGIVNEVGNELPSSSGCAPFDAQFTYTGSGATQWHWDFGDGFESNLENPTHLYAETGSYEIFLVAQNPDACNLTDTVFLNVNVIDATPMVVDTSFCSDENTLLLGTVIPNASYLWHDGFTGAIYEADSNIDGTYFVEITLGECTRTDTFNVFSMQFIDFIEDEITTVCDQLDTLLDLTIDIEAEYLWNNGHTEPTILITEPGFYSLVINGVNSCQYLFETTVTFGSTPEVDLGPDILLCDMEEREIFAISSIDNVSFLWSTGATSNSITPSEEGLYSVEVMNNNCIGTDEVLVEFHPQFNFNDILVNVSCNDFCNGSLSIDPSGGGGQPFNVLWSTGSQNNEISELCPDTYTALVTDNFDCDYEKEFILINPEPITYDLEVADLDCPGDFSGQISFINLTGGVEPFEFSLVNSHDFQDELQFNGLAAGIYYPTLIDSFGCVLNDTIELTQPADYQILVSPDTTILLGESVQINVDIFPLNGQQVQWIPDYNIDCTDCYNPIVNPYFTTNYLLTSVDVLSGCEKVDSVEVRVDKPRNVYVPNAFSPNFDGTNDFFQIFAGIGAESILKFEIYDRWGEKIYEGEPTLFKFKPQGWDGTFRDQAMDPGVFVYRAEVKFLDGHIEVLQGDLTLIR